MSRKSNHPKITACQSLNALAKECDFVLFEMQEISEIIRVGTDALATCRKMGCPFPFGKSRPEWVLEFLKANPKLGCKDRPPLAAEKIIPLKSVLSKRP